MSLTGPFDFQKGDLLEGMTIVSPLVRGGHGDLYLVNEDVEQKKVLKVIQRADNDGELTGIEKCRAPKKTRICLTSRRCPSWSISTSFAPA